MISVMSRCSLITTVFALDQSDVSCRSNRSLKWPCGWATCSIFVSTRWRILVRWCAVENLHLRCRVGAISVASISRCIAVSTGTPQKVRIVSSDSLLVFYPHIAIIKSGLCSWMFFRSGSGQAAPTSVVSISRVGVILSFFIVMPVLISVTLVSTLILPGLAPVSWVCCSVPHDKSLQIHLPSHQNVFPATFGCPPCSQSCQELLLIVVKAWASWPFSPCVGLGPDPYEGILYAEWKWCDLPSFPVISHQCQWGYLHVIPHGRPLKPFHNYNWVVRWCTNIHHCLDIGILESILGLSEPLGH